MNYVLLLIPILFFIGLYVKKRNQSILKDPKIGHIKEHLTDYQIKEVRKEMEWIDSEDDPPRNELCNLYEKKPGSIRKIPALLYHDKEVWINSDQMRRKVAAIHKSTEDKATWEYVKMNTYNKKTTPYDPSDKKVDDQQSLSDHKEVIINPIVTTFDYPDMSPTSPNPYGTVHGMIEDSTDAMAAPKPDYVFSKSYGFRNYK